MKDPESVKIKKRFFEAFDYLLEKKAIKNESQFCAEYNINRGNFYKCRTEDHRSIELGWMAVLVKKFGISADWLIVGKGARLKAKEKVNVS